MAPLSTYQYSSLDTYHSVSIEAAVSTTNFRVLVLDAGRDSDEVSCSIEHHCLTSAPEYEAVSYVWGDPTETCNITCSGQHLSITRSLYHALRRFRLAEQQRTLWADAICINQEDLNERGAQVLIMGKIYSQARQVLIWLGEETARDSEGLDALIQLDRNLPSPPATIGDINTLRTPQFFFRAVQSIPLSSWMQIGYLLSRPWFRRIWVIQEVVMAHSAQLFNGTKTLPWTTFSSALDKIASYDLQTIIAGFKNALVAFKNVSLMRHENNDMRRPFFKLLSAVRDFNSTDPRDKIYALIGIFDSDDIPWKLIDYTIPASDLFIQFTKRELSSGSLAHLSATHYVDDDNQMKLPTWVPDWSRSIDHVPIEALGIVVKAGGSNAPSLSFSPANDHLIIEGKQISRVSRIGTIMYSGLITVITWHGSSTPTASDRAGLKLNSTKWILDWLQDCHRTAFGEDFETSQEVFTSRLYRQFSKALFWESDSTIESDFLRGNIDKFVRLYLLLNGSLKLQSEGKNLVNKDESDIQDAVLVIDSYLAPFSAYKYFCCDDAGRFAWVPRRAKTGDLFCIFRGAAVPYLLRSVQGGQSELIGPCFLQGCMDGVVFEGDDFITKEFVIV